MHLQDVEVAHQAVTAFTTKAKLPICSYLLPELKELQMETECSSFATIFSSINASSSIREVARDLAKCIRHKNPFSTALYLEAEQMFRDIEARIRFSVWPNGKGAPDHFSKLLATKKIRSVLSEIDILAILAIFADPKGLNLRNVVLHGFSMDTSLALPLLHGIYETIIPKLPEYKPRLISFDRQLKLLKFHKQRVSLPSVRKLSKVKFPLIDDERILVLDYCYELYNSGKVIDATIMLFPLFEHSLRRAAVAKLGLPADRLCASSQEHFLSIKECCEVLPDSLQNMVTDLLFAPDGPRLRDAIMHGNVETIPHEFATCLFVLFEQCCLYFENAETSFTWNWAFHPARCLEYELSFITPIDESIDLIRVYDQEFCQRMIETVKLAQTYKEIDFKDRNLWLKINNGFDKLVCACVISMAVQPVKNSAVQQLLALAYLPIKLGPKNDMERFRKTVIEKMRNLQKYLCFIPEEFTYETIEDLCNDECVMIALEFAREKI